MFFRIPHHLFSHFSISTVRNTRRYIGKSILPKTFTNFINILFCTFTTDSFRITCECRKMLDHANQNCYFYLNNYTIFLASFRVFDIHEGAPVIQDESTVGPPAKPTWGTCYFVRGHRRFSCASYYFFVFGKNKILKGNL